MAPARRAARVRTAAARQRRGHDRARLRRQPAAGHELRRRAGSRRARPQGTNFVYLHTAAVRHRAAGQRPGTAPVRPAVHDRGLRHRRPGHGRARSSSSSSGRAAGPRSGGSVQLGLVQGHQRGRAPVTACRLAGGSSRAAGTDAVPVYGRAYPEPAAYPPASRCPTGVAPLRYTDQARPVLRAGRRHRADRLLLREDLRQLAAGRPHRAWWATTATTRSGSATGSPTCGPPTCGSPARPIGRSSPPSAGRAHPRPVEPVETTSPPGKPRAGTCASQPSSPDVHPVLVRSHCSYAADPRGGSRGAQIIAGPAVRTGTDPPRAGVLLDVGLDGAGHPTQLVEGGGEHRRRVARGGPHHVVPAQPRVEVGRHRRRVRRTGRRRRSPGRCARARTPGVARSRAGTPTVAATLAVSTRCAPGGEHQHRRRRRRRRAGCSRSRRPRSRAPPRRARRCARSRAARRSAPVPPRALERGAEAGDGRVLGARRGPYRAGRRGHLRFAVLTDCRGAGVPWESFEHVFEHCLGGG